MSMKVTLRVSASESHAQNTRPAALPMLALGRLRRLTLPWNMLAAEEHALLEVGLAGIDGAAWGPWTRFARSGGEEWFEFTGKGAGSVKCGQASADRKCAEYAATYEKMKAAAEKLIAGARRSGA